MSKSKIEDIISLIEEGKDDLVQARIDSLNEKLTQQEYNSIIDAIFKKLGLNNEEILRNIFRNLPKFNIKTYKELLIMEATIMFNKLKDRNDNVFVSLSKNICLDLNQMDVEEVLEKYKEELEYIKIVNMFDEFVNLIYEHKDSITSHDILKINDSKSKIREFIRIFNMKYKNEYIKNICKIRLEKIYQDFEMKPKFKKITELFNIETFIKMIMNDPDINNSLKIKISNYFNINIDNNNFQTFIYNILNNKDIENYKLLGISNKLIDIERKLKIYKLNKTYHRIERIYLPKINKLFTNSEKLIIIEILNNDNLEKYRKSLNESQISLIYELLVIKKKYNSEIKLVDNNLTIIKRDKLSDVEYQSLKDDINKYQMYNGLKKIILQNYYKNCTNIQELITGQNISIEDNKIFNDDNYQVKNIIFDYALLIEILKKIDCRKINKYNEEQINFLKRILFKEGLLGCVMKYPSCIDISDIINGIDYCEFIQKRNICIERIVKLTRIYGIADEFTISVLGSEVVRKIICNEQFLQTNTIEDKKNRLNRALYLNLLSLPVTKSTIPYDIATKVDGITISRYNNDNPKILSSGIDTGTCFKLDGDDNDFLVYTILNKNGAVLKIEYQNKFIGRISIFRKCKVLFLNSIRIKGEKEEESSKEIIERNAKIYECVVKLARKIISIAEMSNDEIDYVVCNKAGILESSYFKNDCPIVPDHIVANPIDTYNADWKEFISSNFGLLKQSNQGKNVAFTTDYGHYAALQIASRNNDCLTSLFSIGYDSPEPIYERPKSPLRLYTSNFKNILEEIYRIHALKFYEEVGDIALCKKLYKRPQINQKMIDKISIGDYYYKIEYKDGKTEEVSLKLNSDNYKLLKRK